MDTSDQYLDCLCRTCLNEVETSAYGANTTPQQQWKSIFDRIEECDALQIAELLSQAVPQMEMDLSDELPKKICVKCLQQLLSAYRFQQMCLQSEELMREMLSKRLTDLKMSTIKKVMERELGTNDTDSYPLINFLSSTLENLQHPSIQDPLLEAIEQVIESEAAQSCGAEHLDNIEKLLEAYKDAQGNFHEFNKNERIEEGGPDIEYTDGGTTHSKISVTNDELLAIDAEEQQENVMNVKEHCLGHDEERPYECPYCRQRYRSNGSMIRHKKQTHESTKQEACDICGKKFVRKWDLKVHKRIHTDGRPHKCDVCEKRYSRIQELRRHKCTPYKCNYCERAFSSRIQRNEHLRTHQGQIDSYRCKFCPLAFPLLSELRLHFITHKNEDPKTRKRNIEALREEAST